MRQQSSLGVGPNEVRAIWVGQKVKIIEGIDIGLRICVLISGTSPSPLNKLILGGQRGKPIVGS